MQNIKILLFLYVFKLLSLTFCLNVRINRRQKGHFPGKAPRFAASVNINVKNTEEICKNSKVRLFEDDHAKCVGKPIAKIQNLKKEVLFDPKKVSEEKSHLELHHHIYEEYLHLVDTYKAWYYSYTSSCCKATGGEGKICKPRKADELPSTHCAEYKHHFLDVHLMLQKLKSEEKFADDYLNKKLDKDSGDEEKKKKYLTYNSKVFLRSKGEHKRNTRLEISKILLPDLEGKTLKEFIKKYESSNK